jgi:hypothetical protein
MKPGNQDETFAQSGFDPVPTDLEVALPAEPMRVYPTALTVFNYLSALGDQVEGSDG